MGDLKNSPERGEAGVVDYARVLREQGYETEIFAGERINKDWKKQIEELQAEHNMEIPPDDIIHQTQFYKENMKWALRPRNEGYTVIDIGNPNGRKDLGPFYSGEREVIFGGASAEKVIDLTRVNGY